MITISLINMKGGVGKTTLTINLAHFLSNRENSKVLVVDIDPQFNSTQCLFSGEEYVDYLKNNNDTIINIFDDSVKSKLSTVKGTTKESAKELKDVEPFHFSDNLHILPGNLELYKLDMASGTGRENRLKQYLREINKKNKYDFVLIDTPPTPSVWMTSALIASQYYLIPVKPDPISFVGIDLLENIIDQKRDSYDLSIKCIGLVMTMIDRIDSTIFRNAKAYVKKNKKWAPLLFKKHLPKRSEIAKLQLQKQFILDSTNSEIKTALAGIVSELKIRLEDEQE